MLQDRRIEPAAVPMPGGGASIELADLAITLVTGIENKDCQIQSVAFYSIWADTGDYGTFCPS